MFLLVFQRIFLEAILDIFYFPVWWYTGGALHALIWCKDFFLSGNQTLAPGLWLANLFVPMFGQYDIQGRIISVFMRLIQFVLRSVALAFWLVISIILFCVWLALPVLFVYGFVNSFSK
jgi:hypothetical protein